MNQGSNKMQQPAATQVVCGRCKGTGKLEGRNATKLTCFTCRGSGKVTSGVQYNTK